MEKIEKVIILCLENRSYHHIFGAYEGNDNLITDTTKDVVVSTPHSKTGACVDSFFKNPFTSNLLTFGFKISSIFSDWTYYLNKEKNSCFWFSEYDILTKSFAKNSLPNIHYLYENYTSCSRWFHSIGGPTYPNKMYLFSGTSKNKNVNEEITNNIDDNDQETILTLLEKNNKNWRVYYGSSSDFRFFKAHKDVNKTIDGKFRDIEQFYNDVHSDNFPDFTIVEANYESVNQYLATDFHPETSLPFRSDNFVGQVYSSIKNSKLWENSLFILTFDEWGGFYDPIAPISYSDCNSGFRVPTLLISKWIKKGYIDNTIYDHTSMIKTVVNLFDLKNVNLGTRINEVNPIDKNSFI